MPSRPTVLRAASTRRALEDHFRSIIEDTAARRSRLEQFTAGLGHTHLSEDERQALTGEFLAEESQIARSSRSRLQTARFEKLKLIGRGGFGDVWLVRDKITFDYYALKVLSKATVISRDQLANVRSERDILSQTATPWVVELKASFQDDANLYLVLEYVPGGDLMTALEKRDSFPESTARFFAGEIALAINSVHSVGVVHRDLKPENVLIGEDGHIKLTDFGLSTNYSRLDKGRRRILDEIQQLVGHVRAGPEVGTYRYSAPEVLRGGPATAASDFWSLGVIIYEMLFAGAPFNGKSAHETMLRITHHKRSLRFPRGASPAAVDLIRNLLCEAEVRYGFAEIVTHPFFQGFDFEHVEMNVAPMVPVLTHPADTSHFGDVPEDDDRDADVDDRPGLAQAAFLGFTYKQRPRNMTLARLGIF